MCVYDIVFRPQYNLVQGRDVLPHWFVNTLTIARLTIHPFPTIYCLIIAWALLLLSTNCSNSKPEVHRNL